MSTTTIIAITTTIIGIVLAVLLVHGGAKAGAWQFPPPGGELAPTIVLERPDGQYEAWPARCRVFEDGSAQCGEWDQDAPDYYRDEQLQTW